MLVGPGPNSVYTDSGGLIQIDIDDAVNAVLSLFSYLIFFSRSRKVVSRHWVLTSYSCQLCFPETDIQDLGDNPTAVRPVG